MTAEQNNFQTKTNGHEHVSVDAGGITINEIQLDPTMNCIQEGILHAVKDVDSKPLRELYPMDYLETKEFQFNKWDELDKTPAYSYPSFTFMIHAPLVFRFLRNLFEIKTYEYKRSICDLPLHELSNPGASGSIFYITQDNKFIMKTLTATEGELLKKILLNYSINFKITPGSLLTKFSGLYDYIRGSINIKLISMCNLIPSNIEIHHKYDLKGSNYGRNASHKEKLKKSPTFKDLDFRTHHPDGIFLMPDTRKDLLIAIKFDIDFLKELNIMDYSILIGVHNIDKVSIPKTPLHEASEARWERLMVNSIRMKSIQENTDSMPEKDFASLRGSIPAKNGSGERLLLFVGIIDILQQYQVLKIVEHKLKVTMLSKNVSVQKPENYATRLYEFLSKYVKLIFVYIFIHSSHLFSNFRSVFKPLFPEECKNLSKQQRTESLSKRTLNKSSTLTLHEHLKRSKT